MARYDALTTYLNQQPDRVLRLSFADIERVLERKLPASAARQRAFWSNNAANNVMTRAWLAAGFRSEQVDLTGRTVVFRKQEVGRTTGTEEAKMTGFGEAHAPFDFAEETTGTFPLFGWMKGTITFAPGLDLTEPADPDLGNLLDDIYGPPA